MLEIFIWLGLNWLLLDIIRLKPSRYRTFSEWLLLSFLFIIVVLRLKSASIHLNIKIYWNHFYLIRAVIAMIKETKYSNKPWARDVCSYVLGRGGERGVWCVVPHSWSARRIGVCPVNCSMFRDTDQLKFLIYCWVMLKEILRRGHQYRHSTQMVKLKYWSMYKTVC